MTDPLNKSRDHGRGERPSVLERLRSLFFREEASVRGDIEEALQDDSTSSDISAQERAMLRNVLNLHELRVSDVMVTRGDIVAVSLDNDLAHVMNVFRTAGHSRIPVYAETLDDPRGMIHIRDFFNYLAATGSSSSNGRLEIDNLAHSVASANIVRPVLFVPPSMPALELLVKMQAARTHMAIVIDEYGGTDGLASIEDIVELIVGDIEDEHDPVEGPLVARTEDGGWVIDARARLDEVEEGTGLDMSEGPHADAVETIGGLVTMIAGRVPAKGERFIFVQDVEFEVMDADPRRVKRIFLRVTGDKREENASGGKDGADRQAGPG